VQSNLLCPEVKCMRRKKSYIASAKSTRTALDRKERRRTAQDLASQIGPKPTKKTKKNKGQIPRKYYKNRGAKIPPKIHRSTFKIHIPHQSDCQPSLDDDPTVTVYDHDPTVTVHELTPEQEAAVKARRYIRVR
jgi:hypothetical protein